MKLLFELGLRNLVAHKIKSLVVGGILFFGVLMVVVGGALLDSVRQSMARSITSSLAGDAQVYASDSPDELELFPMGGGGAVDYGEILDFPKVRDVLKGVDNVREVVPMGITSAIVFGTPEIDRVLTGLRDAIDRGDASGREAWIAHTRAIVDGLRRDVANSRASLADQAEVDQQLVVLDHVGQDAFWDGLRADPAPALELLDTKVAPLAVDGRLLYLRVIGTDLELFSNNFSSFQLIEGSLPPPGEPGILLASRFYERQVKDKVARDLDALAEGVAAGDTIAGTSTLTLTASRLPKQVQTLLVQIPPSEAGAVRDRIASELGIEGDLRACLSGLLTVDDATLAARRALFYEVVAPHIRLYEVPVGQEVVLRSFTKSGYQRATAVKVWGVFTFTGLEGSDLAGFSNLVDMETFRSMYGRLTAAQQDELAGIRAAAGVADISREDAEAALFGGGPAAEPAAVAAPAERAPEGASTLALNAAVLFDDPSRGDDTITALRAKIAEEGLALDVVDWQRAAGLVGQIITVLEVILVVAIGIIFLVALVILNNTMVMTTLDRTTEIGTLRAIGAPKAFVISMFMVETLVLALIAGALGAAVGVGFVLWLGHVGVPAVADIMVLLFAGKRLYPEVGVDNALMGAGVVVVVAVLSTLYPAFLASRVPPVVAMQGKD